MAFDSELTSAGDMWYDNVRYAACLFNRCKVFPPNAPIKIDCDVNKT
jgi:hypothetical protein